MTTIASMEDFCRLESDWETLANHRLQFLPFLCHGWFRIWIKHFSSDNQLCVFRIAEKENLFAFAPLIRKAEKHRGLLVSKLELIGNTYSPIRSFIFDPSAQEQPDRTVDAFFSNLYAGRDASWDILDLSALPEESPFFESAGKYLSEHGFPFSEYPCFGDWYQDGIDCTGNDYISRLPEKIRKDFQYCKRRLVREGRLEFKVLTSTEHLEDHLDMYYGVYGRSWQKQEKVGPTFHRDLARMVAEKGWLRLAFLFHNDIPIAAQFWIVSGRTAFILKTVYDQGYKKYSPGKVLTSEMFKYVIDVDKVSSIDYVQGDEEYKKHWTPKRRERRGILIYNSTVKGRCLSLVDRNIIPIVNRNKRLRRLKQALSGLMRSHG